MRLAGARLWSVPGVQRQVARRTALSARTTATAATLETATKQNVGAAASRSQTHVGLNSGHLMPLFGWGTSGSKDDNAIQRTKSALEVGYRVRCFYAMLANGRSGIVMHSLAVRQAWAMQHHCDLNSGVQCMPPSMFMQSNRS